MSRVVRPAASALANRAGISTWTPSDTRLRRQRQCELIWRFRPRVIFELIVQPEARARATWGDQPN